MTSTYRSAMVSEYVQIICSCVRSLLQSLVRTGPLSNVFFKQCETIFASETIARFLEDAKFLSISPAKAPSSMRFEETIP